MRSELPAVADEKEDNAFVGHKIVTQYVDSNTESNTLKAEKRGRLVSLLLSLSVAD